MRFFSVLPHTMVEYHWLTDIGPIPDLLIYL